MTVPLVMLAGGARGGMPSPLVLIEIWVRPGLGAATAYSDSHG